eukprot:SAG11_NODE_160_length_14023_cov_23.003017_13_plen_155_part_00
MLFLHDLGSNPAGLAHRLELRLKPRIDPKIVASGPLALVWELRHLQRGHFGAVHGAAGGDLINTGTYCCALHSFGTVGTKIYRRIRTDLACVTRRILCDTHCTAVRIRIRTLVDLSTNYTRNRKVTLVPGTTSVERLSTPVVADGERPQADAAV